MVSPDATAARRPRWQTFLLVGLLIVATVAAGMFAARTYRSYQVLRSARDLGASDVGSIRGWMTIQYIAKTYRVPEGPLRKHLDLPANGDKKATLRALAQEKGVDVLEYVQEVQRAVVELRRPKEPVPNGRGP